MKQLAVDGVKIEGLRTVPKLTYSKGAFDQTAIHSLVALSLIIYTSTVCFVLNASRFQQ